MKQSKSLIIVGFMITFAGLIMFGCASREDLLHIGLIAPSTNHLPVLLAEEEGLLEGKPFKFHRFSSGWEVNEAIISGKIDLAIMPFTYAWQGVAENKGVRIISFLERESDGIVARKEIRTISDLDGRRVGVLRASTLDIFFHMVLDDYDIDPEIIYFRTPTEMAAALTSGHVDALSFYVPVIFQFDEQFHDLLWYSDLYPEHPCCDIVVYEESLLNKGDQIGDFMEIISDACDLLTDDQERGVKIIITRFGYSREIAQKTLQQQKFITGLEEEGRHFHEQVMKKMLELGYLRTLVSPDEVYYDLSEAE